MTPQAAAAEEAAAYVSRYRWLILLGLITAAIMEVLDTTIVNVALPQMAGNLGATRRRSAWVSTGYILSNVVVLPMTAFFTERLRAAALPDGLDRHLHHRLVLLRDLHSLSELVVWRMLQGAGGAALLSTAQATLRQIFPREQQGLVQAIFLLGIIVAPTLGPTLGGWITDNYSWNWCFFINVPIGSSSAFLVSRSCGIRRGRCGAPGPVDWLGIGCSRSASARCSGCWRKETQRIGSPTSGSWAFPSNTYSNQ